MKRMLMVLAVGVSGAGLTGCGGGGTPMTGGGSSSAGSGYQASASGATQRAVVAVLDGIRYCESFGDADPSTGLRPPECPAWDGTDHDLAPGMWNTLRPQGAIGREFFNVSAETTTMVGVGTIDTGAEGQYTAKRPKYLKNPTIGEYMRKQMGLSSLQTQIFSAYLDPAGAEWIPLSVNRNYGEAYWPKWTASGASDSEAYAAFKGAFLADKPRFSLVHLWDIDARAHAGDWEGYKNAIRTADGLMTDLWSAIQSDSVLSGSTALFIVTDHGRNCDDWRHHETGDACSRRLTFMALGPEIKAGHESFAAQDQRSIAPTIGALLGFSASYSTGSVFSDILSSYTEPSSGESSTTTAGSKGGAKKR